MKNRYTRRVSSLLRELARTWRITLLAPMAAVSDGDLDQLGIARHIPLPFAAHGAPTIPASGSLPSLAPAIAAANPAVALVWADAEPLMRTKGFPPTVIDRLDSEVVMALRAARTSSGPIDRVRAIRNAAAWTWRERAIIRSCRTAIVSSEYDARWMRRLAPHGSVQVVSGGIDVAPTPDHASEAPDPTVIFSGTLHDASDTNILAVHWFVEHAWPAIRAAVPRAQFMIVGRAPAASVRRLHDPGGGIHVVPDVPDMFAPLRRAWVSVAPLRNGAGVPTKVLEAWAVGRPVVLSPIAATGFDLDADTAPLVAADPHFADAVIGLLRNREARRAAGDAAYSLALSHYNGWSASAEHLSRILAAAMG